MKTRDEDLSFRSNTVLVPRTNDKPGIRWRGRLLLQPNLDHYVACSTDKQLFKPPLQTTSTAASAIRHVDLAHRLRVDRVDCLRQLQVFDDGVEVRREWAFLGRRDALLYLARRCGAHLYGAHVSISYQAPNRQLHYRKARVSMDCIEVLYAVHKLPCGPLGRRAQPVRDVCENG